MCRYLCVCMYIALKKHCKVVHDAAAAVRQPKSMPNSRAQAFYSVLQADKYGKFILVE